MTDQWSDGSVASSHRTKPLWIFCVQGWEYRRWKLLYALSILDGMDTSSDLNPLSNLSPIWRFHVPSRSKFKYIGHIGYNIWSNRDRHLIFGVHVNLTRLYISSGNIIRSRSFFKVKGQMFCPYNINIGNNFWADTDRDLIFGKNVYFIKLHILRGKMSWSRSSFKVKGISVTLAITFDPIEIDIWCLVYRCIS